MPLGVQYMYKVGSVQVYVPSFLGAHMNTAHMATVGKCLSQWQRC